MVGKVFCLYLGVLEQMDDDEDDLDDEGVVYIMTVLEAAVVVGLDHCVVAGQAGREVLAVAVVCLGVVEGVVLSAVAVD